MPKTRTITDQDIKAFDDLETFKGENLTATLAAVEAAVRGVTSKNAETFLDQHNAPSNTLYAAGRFKKLFSQIDVVIHALGILRCLPHILKKDEQVEYVSLGAGNTGRPFDLETNLRIAEFKFIRWQGGAESIRQNQAFKDFFLLAESGIEKEKYLYVLNTEHPLNFFNGSRNLRSVLSRNHNIQEQFAAKYGGKFKHVCDYYKHRKDDVRIEDMSRWLPELVRED
ncbi:MAG: hypothetical protein ACYYKD_11320 [Rhodospirillales bacterium]